MDVKTGVLPFVLKLEKREKKSKLYEHEIYCKKYFYNFLRYLDSQLSNSIDLKK